MNNKAKYIGDEPNLIKDKEYIVIGMKRVCFSGPVNSGTYYLIKDESEKEVFIHSRNFIGSICLLSDEEKKIVEERREELYKKMRAHGYNI
jgi:lipocalin